ncbi:MULTISPECIES: SCO family protein [unclassified Janthinobacterium]|uniref:SCO family protein n=1 Tax=unclassified Janthinobacterium TaxID=2610881 RepID=UPI000349D35D|nr:MULTISPECIES: SCO family protein [unclassified Janthinobacterium]MEC5160332.1 protein SCO1/2 [Janthinobacterium sp. CG_S6]
MNATMTTRRRPTLPLLPLLMLAALGCSAPASAQTDAAAAAHADHAAHRAHMAQDDATESAADAKPAAVPGASLYHLKGALVDQDGRSFKLEQRRGQPMLVSMFYNSCKFVCPMLIDTLRATEQTLTAEERAKVSVLLITFDPARDDVKALKAVARQRGLAPGHWTLARTDAGNVRQIAAALDIQYRQLADGEYNHTTVLLLLDGEGRIVGRTKKLGAVDPAFQKLLRQTIRAAGNAKAG